MKPYQKVKTINTVPGFIAVNRKKLLDTGNWKQVNRDRYEWTKDWHV